MANTKMFVHYSKTKAEFIAAGLPTQYHNSIVFIKGDDNGVGSCIYTHGTYFANFTEFIEAYVSALNYVKGVNVNGTNYNAAAGGGYVAFSASDPTTVAVNAGQNGITIGLTAAFIGKVNSVGSASDAAAADGTAFARIAQLAKDLSDLTGEGSGSVSEQIAALKQAIEGDLSKDATDAKTLEAINDELNAIDAKWSSYVSHAELAVIGDTKDHGTDVNVSVTTLGGKVTEVKVTETGLTNKLKGKANVGDSYLKSETYTKAEVTAEADRLVKILETGAVQTNTEAIAKLNGGIDIAGSVDKKIHDAINAFAGSADSDNVIENVTELLAYVSKVDGGKDLSLAIADIEANKAAISTLKGNDQATGSVAKSVKDAIDSEVARADKAYAVKGTEKVASDAAARAEEAYGLAGQKATAAEAKAQAQAAISEIAEATKADTDNAYVKVTVKTKAGSVSSVEVDDAGVKTYADQVAGTAKSEAIAATAESLKSYYTKTEVDAMWLWEEL